MALKGTLALDTAPYNRALDQAKAALQSFGLDTSKVGADMRKMTTSLDGSKIAAQAHAAAAAIQGIGGASALTEREAKKHLAVIQEGIAKLSKEAGGVPPHLAQVARDLEKVSGQTRNLGTTAQAALGTFAGFLGAQAITAGLRALGDGFRFVASTAIDTNRDLERTTLQFQTLMGDADRATAHVRGLFEFARNTPFETQPIIAASKSLQVFGGDALNTAENLRMVGDAAASTGAPINEVGFWVGRLYANLAAGRPIGEAAQRLTELAVLAPTARNALEDVAKGGASVEEKFRVMQQSLGQFSGAMQLQSGTWEGVMSNFRESVQMTIADGLRPLFEAARDTLRELMALADAGLFRGWSVSVGGAVDAVADKLRAVPRVLATISLGFEQIKLDALEVQRSFAELAATLAAKLGDTFRLYAQIPGIGQAAYGALAGMAGGQEISVRGEVARLTTEIADQQKVVTDAQVKLASYLVTTAGVGAVAGQARPTIGAFGDALSGAGDKAGRAARQVREVVTAVELLNRPGYFTEFLRGGQSSGAGGGFLTTGTNLTNPWGGIGMLAPGGGGANFSSLMRPGFNFGGVGLAGLGAAMPFLSQLITGGSRGGQIGGSVGGTLGGILGSKDLFGGLAGMGGFAGVLGAAAPFMGPVLGLVGGLIGKLFGPSRGAILGKEADARIGNTQAGLLQQFGSVDNIRALGPYGSALADAWGSKNVEGEAWFSRLNEGLQEQLSLQEQIKSVEEQRKALVESLVPTWEQLTQAASRYGFDLTELGTQVQQLGSTETFKTILEDLDLFGRATDDVGAYLSRMSGQISLAVQQALRFGTEVPENMKPFIQNLLETGQLLDENGNAITDLSALRWGPAIQTQADIVREAIEKLNDTFDKLTLKLDELFDKLANGLPDAAARGAAGANSAFGQIEPVVPGGERGIEGFASGSGGIRDFGNGTLAVLHGREAVLTERQLRNMGGGVAVTINVAGYLDSQVSRSHLASVVASEIGRELRVRRRA